jgi:hypothetical protein
MLKPESSFKNLHELLTYLPIDYYILLQQGYKGKKFNFLKQRRTNMVMFNNLPVLQQKSTFYNKNQKIVKALTYEDVNRALEKQEAKSMLESRLAEQEMQALIEKYYGGKVKRLEFINWDADKVVRQFHSPAGELSQDHLNEFQQIIDYGGKRQNKSLSTDQATVDMNEYIRNQLEFDDILNNASSYFSASAQRV